MRSAYISGSFARRPAGESLLVRQPAWRMPALFFNRTVVISSTLYPMERLSQEFGAGDRRFTSLWRVIGRGFGASGPRKTYSVGVRGAALPPLAPPLWMESGGR